MTNTECISELRCWYTQETNRRGKLEFQSWQDHKILGTHAYGKLEVACFPVLDALSVPRVPSLLNLSLGFVQGVPCPCQWVGVVPSLDSMKKQRNHRRVTKTAFRPIANARRLLPDPLATRQLYSSEQVLLMFQFTFGFPLVRLEVSCQQVPYLGRSSCRDLEEAAGSCHRS